MYKRQVFVPAIFVLMDDLSRLLKRLLGRFVGARDEPADALEYGAPEHPANDGRPMPPRIAAE